MSLSRRLILLVASVSMFLRAGASVVVNGIVRDIATGEPLSFAVIKIAPGDIITHSDAEGHWSVTLPDGSHTISISYIGYRTLTKVVEEGSGSRTIEAALSPDNHQLGEVTVTARESSGLTSGSRIDRDAMSHLQPTSFTDLLELLPGNVSQTPDMGRVNSITLRETGTIGATGSAVDNPDYAITSLGTPFIVDGTPIGTDGNLNRIPGATTGDASSLRSVVNRGVDMRSISTDNIESVEVMRGIPSAEYGNLTSGVINIKRIRRATPWSARFKADEFSKLFSAGKGWRLGNTDHLINTDAGYLDSKIDPRNNLENYRRLNASVRLRFMWRHPSATISWNLSADYTGSFDNSKSDPDLSRRKIDTYQSRYHRGAFSSEFIFAPRKTKWLNTIALNLSASYVADKLWRIREVTPNGTPLAPTSMEAGVHDGEYLLGTYVADFYSDSRPVDVFTKLRAAGNYATGPWTHDYKAGVEWTFTKNYGCGQVYDLGRPLSGGWTTRPRSFRSVPALHTLGAFAEWHSALAVGTHRLEMQAGVRAMMLPALQKMYYLAGRQYFDPRINVQWTLPQFYAVERPMRLSVTAGYGLTTRMPTLDYLFPQVHYADFVQLGYYDVRDPYRLSAVNLRTYVVDPTNYSLHAARNRKQEIRFNIEWGRNRLSVTYFIEKMRDGYRYSTVYDAYEFRKYDASAIDPSTLTAPPRAEQLPYTDMRILGSYSKVTNGTRIDKQGVEVQISTERWRPLATALTITGAWLRSTYSNSQMLFSPVSQVINNVAVSDCYVGLYSTADGRTNHRFSTNFMFDTQIPRWGLIFTTTVQAVWWTRTRRMAENGVPVAYISADDGLLHPFTDIDKTDAMRQHLVKHYSPQLFEPMQVPMAIYLNFKATKQIGRWLRISAYVNRILDYIPDYKSNGLTIRRTAEAYFGMEATITI